MNNYKKYIVKIVLQYFFKSITIPEILKIENFENSYVLNNNGKIK